MTGYESVAGFLIGFTAACELRGYPSWLNRTLLNQHLVTAESLCHGRAIEGDRLTQMVEFSELLREAIVTISDEQGLVEQQLEAR